MTRVQRGEERTRTRLVVEVVVGVVEVDMVVIGGGSCSSSGIGIIGKISEIF
jgi:hypothetical protein